MKKYLLFIITVIALPLMILEVNAISTSIGWNYEYNDGSYQMIDLNPQNTDVPIYLEWDGNKKYTLHLNNYNGPGLVFGQGGSGNTDNVEVIIDLVGTNTITTSKIGLDLWISNDKPITFTGTGTLKLNARIPMSNDTTRTFIDPSNDNKAEDIVDKEDNDDTVDSTISDVTEDKNTTKENEFNYKTLFIISSIISIILSVVCFVLIFKLKKNNNPQ